MATNKRWMLQHADIIQISSSNNIKIIVFIQIEVASTDLFWSNCRHERGDYCTVVAILSALWSKGFFVFNGELQGRK